MATFHDKHGLGVRLSVDKTIAAGVLVIGYEGGPSSDVVFSKDPVKMGKITTLKVEGRGVLAKMGIGLTAQDPVQYKEGHISDIPQTWYIDTYGDVYQDGGMTEGVCPRWNVSTGDTVSIEWSQPTVTVYKNTEIIHSQDIPYTGKVWMVADLDIYMTLEISGHEISSLEEKCFQVILQNVKLSDLFKLPLPNQLKEKLSEMYTSKIML